MGVSGRESWPALSCVLHNCTNPSLRFQFLPLISELVLPTHMVRCDQIYCPETAPILTAFTYLSRCEIINVAWKNVKGGVSDKTMCSGWTDSLHFCVCPYPVWSRGSLWWRMRKEIRRNCSLCLPALNIYFYELFIARAWECCICMSACLLIHAFTWSIFFEMSHRRETLQ